MNKILRIKKLQSEWKAAETNAVVENNVKDLNYASGGLFCLDAALTILNEPSNTRIHVDKKPRCKVCNINQENRIYDKYCGDCGRAFD